MSYELRFFWVVDRGWRASGPSLSGRAGLPPLVSTVRCAHFLSSWPIGRQLWGGSGLTSCSFWMQTEVQALRSPGLELPSVFSHDLPMENVMLMSAYIPNVFCHLLLYFSIFIHVFLKCISRFECMRLCVQYVCVALCWYIFVGQCLF